jgi:hypothetical protein
VPIMQTIKRAPKWAWVTAAGVGIGAGVIKLYQDRDAEPSDDGATDPVGTPTGGGTVGGAPPAIVVPPIVQPVQNDSGDSGAAWVPAIQDTLSAWFGIVTQGQSALTDIALNSNDGLVALATAGGAPGQTVQNPTPIVVNVPVTQPAPTPIATVSQPQPVADRIVDTCHSAYNHDGDCWTCTVNKWASGKITFSNCHRVHKGKCSDPKGCFGGRTGEGTL